MNPPTQEERRARALWYLEKLLFVPYLWCGNSPLSGLDCNGLIHEIFQAVGLEPRGFDSTANSLWQAWKIHVVEIPKAGCLVFWLKDGYAFHVGMMIDDWCMISASGGDKKTTSKEKAAKLNAMVRLDFIIPSNPARRFVDPFHGA